MDWMGYNFNLFTVSPLTFSLEFGISTHDSPQMFPPIFTWTQPSMPQEVPQEFLTIQYGVLPKKHETNPGEHICGERVFI